MIFRFKQFSVSHANSSMKVGTDAVLLGVWAEIKNCKNILDIGTGCGIIALIMAQKNLDTIIKAIDIDEKSINEASENFELSPWKNRLEATLISIQEYSSLSEIAFDHIICNPPFFSNSTPAPNKTRHHARHTDTLSPEDFFKSCKILLADEGKISLIIPFDISDKWVETAESFQLFPNKITQVISYPLKPIERILIEFSDKKEKFLPNELFIRKGKGLGFTDEYFELTKEFYL